MGYRVAVVGATGNVGHEMLSILAEREFPADEVAELLDDQAEKEEKVLPRVLSFFVTPDQEQIIERAVELASDGTPGRDRKARGLANLAQQYLENRDEDQSQEDS